METGDRYLDMLASFVEANVASLVDGTLVLKLNPLGLHYLQARLDSLHELEQLRTAAPVDYLRAYVADLGDHRALELLRRVLCLLSSVKVVSFPGRDPTPITVLPFGRLKTLELRGCDLSTSAARGLLQLRPHLKKLICHNSMDALRHVFAERMVEVQSSAAWTRLTSVSCACNDILVMDDSLQLLPAVEVLDLKRNRLTHVANLHKCTRLKYLDLAFNSIRSVSMLEQVASTLTTLILRFNALATTKGIDKLSVLEHLDLSNNVISSFYELERLGSLCFLSSLALEGNPIAFARGYRQKAFSALANPLKVCLDGKTMSRMESWTVNKLLINKTKQEGGYGLYAPAFKPLGADAEEEADVHKAKKREPRVAVIEDDEERRRMDHIHEYAPPVDVEAGVTSPIEAVESESKLQQLMRRVKKDNSAVWLREISKIFESDPGSRNRNLGTAPVRQRSKHLRRKRSTEPSLVDRPESAKVELDDAKLLDNFDHRPQLGSLTATPLSSTPSSPPHFNTEVLQRRQNLEEELLRLRSSVDGSSVDSDTSTTSSELEIDAGLVRSRFETAHITSQEDVPSTSGAAASSSTLLVEDSCFLDPMWVGSKQENASVTAPEAPGPEVPPAEVQDESSSSGLKKRRSASMQKIRKSRQAWRVVPLEYDAEACLSIDSDSVLKRSLSAATASTASEVCDSA